MERTNVPEFGLGAHSCKQGLRQGSRAIRGTLFLKDKNLFLKDKCPFVVRGEVVESGDALQVLAMSRHPYTRSLIDTASAPEWDFQNFLAATPAVALASVQQDAEPIL